MIRALLALALVWGQDKPVEKPQETPKEKPNEAEALYKKLEEKALKAKTIVCKSKLAIEERGKTMEFEFDGSIKEGNKVKILFEGESPMGPMQITITSDGTKLLVENSMGRGGAGDTESDTPKDLGEGLRTMLVRIGALSPMIIVRPAREGEEAPALKDAITASEFALGKDEKVGEKLCKVLTYKVTRQGEKDSPEVTLHVDPETLVIHKRLFKGNRGEEFAETFTKFEYDAEVKDEVFALPKKEEKKDEKK
jgi:hypothetical protein